MKKLIATIVLVVMVGCAVAPNVGSMGSFPAQSKCWHPESKKEMEDLIGNTVLKAINQYNQRMLKLKEKAQKPGGKMRLEPKPL